MTLTSKHSQKLILSKKRKKILRGFLVIPLIMKITRTGKIWLIYGLDYFGFEHCKSASLLESFNICRTAWSFLTQLWAFLNFLGNILIFCPISDTSTQKKLSLWKKLSLSFFNFLVWIFQLLILQWEHPWE